MARTRLVAGNWKMNKTAAEAKAFFEAFNVMPQTAGSEVVFCVPFTSLETSVAMTEGTKIGIGAQNIHFENAGAFTGEVSAEMLKATGAQWVVLGHSERREYFAETDDTVNKKIKKALEYGITPIVCCGESLYQRENGITFAWIASQLRLGYVGISAEDAKKTVIAYEPIWAIGTGKVATDDQAQEVCAFIRAELAAMYDEETAQSIRILYGGSVSPDSAAGLFSMPDIDGGLVGGASLVADKFIKIVNA